MNQPPLFDDDDEPRVRNTDPDTSHAAADNLHAPTVNTRCARYLEVIRAAGAYGATRDDIADAVDARGAEDRALSRRITDLAHAGHVFDSQRRRRGVSNMPQIVWIAVR